MRIYQLAVLIVCLVCGLPVGLGAQSDVSTTVVELKAMVAALQSQVSAIHSTLLTQQTLSIEQVCRSIATTLVHDEPKDCSEVQASGSTKSGVYTIKPEGGAGVEAYCDLEKDGGGWTVIQKREDGTEEFYRTYAEYEEGFGNKTGEYYLGNKHIHALTSTGKHELLVELEDFQSHVKTAHYSSFSVGNSSTKYTLAVSGYNGTAGDSFAFDHNGHKFSAHDADNDDAGSVNCAEQHHGGYWYSNCFKSNINTNCDSFAFDHNGHKFSAHDADNDDAGSVNCAEQHHGGYWYSNCFKSNINGKWGVAGNQGIIWGSYKDWQMYVLKRTVMKVRPVKTA